MNTLHKIVAATLLLCAALLPRTAAHAQCPQVNTAFKSGERLEYKLYFNWKFVWINAGSATLITKDTNHNGQKGYRSHLLTRTSKRLDRFFSMRDTLECIVTQDIIPLYYRKGAFEGGKYRVDEVSYSYPDGKCRMDMFYQNPSGKQTRKVMEKAECVYDMVSMMLRARSFKGSDFKVGERIHFDMVDGRNVEPQQLIYRGIKQFTTEETNITYRCMVFSFVEKKGKKEKEVITFYVTDDENHLPVRLDMFLKFGVAKAYMKHAQGVRNPQTAIIKKGK